MSKLAKPQFIKVKELLNGRSGFNVYVKVVKTEESKSNDGLTTFVRAVVADESASVNTYFKGETAKLIKQGAVIAIRNGKIRFIKNKISLEIDIFGRVTPEKVQIKANDAENISDKEIERNRRPRQDRPREDRPRRPRQHDDERPPRRNRDFEDRPPRRDREDRPPRRDHEDRPPRRDHEDRPPRRNREENDRPPRRNREDDRDFERRERRGGDREGERERRPRRDYEDRDRQERRPPLNWTKIGAIEPGDENINILAQVVSAEKLKNKVRLVLGDETGTVRAFMFQDEFLEEGNTVVLFKASAPVIKQHIEVQLPRGGRVEKARREVREVNNKYDVSAKEWVEAS